MSLRVVIAILVTGLLVAVGGVISILDSPSQRANRLLIAETPLPQQIDGAKSSAAVRRRTVEAHTFDSAIAYPLDSWSVEGTAAGWFDGVTQQGKDLAAGGTLSISQGDVIEARGWAGDPILGMRFPSVLLVVCGRVIASVPVSEPRADVGRNVHPNLMNAGWRAVLAISDFPRCGSMVLRAYGVAPARRIVFPLTGEFTLEAPGATEGVDLDVVRIGSVLRPEDIPAAPETAQISIKAARANLRRCGDAKCEVAGGLSAGQHEIAILDETKDWLLVYSSKGTGWLARSLVDNASLQRRQNQPRSTR